MLIELVHTQIEGSEIAHFKWYTVPPRTLAVINVQVDLKAAWEGHIFYVQPSQVYINEHPTMLLIPTIYKVDSACATIVTCMLIKFG